MVTGQKFLAGSDLFSVDDRTARTLQILNPRGSFFDSNRGMPSGYSQIVQHDLAPGIASDRGFPRFKCVGLRGTTCDDGEFRDGLASRRTLHRLHRLTGRIPAMSTPFAWTDEVRARTTGVAKSIVTMRTDDDE